MNDPDIRAIKKWLNEQTTYIPREDIVALIAEYESQQKQILQLKQYAQSLTQLITSCGALAIAAMPQDNDI